MGNTLEVFAKTRTSRTRARLAIDFVLNNQHVCSAVAVGLQQSHWCIVSVDEPMRLVIIIDSFPFWDDVRLTYINNGSAPGFSQASHATLFDRDYSGMCRRNYDGDASDETPRSTCPRPIDDAATYETIGIRFDTRLDIVTKSTLFVSYLVCGIDPVDSN
jgi:hypothetical protein